MNECEAFTRNPLSKIFNTIEPFLINPIVEGSDFDENHYMHLEHAIFNAVPPEIQLELRKLCVSFIEAMPMVDGRLEPPSLKELQWDEQRKKNFIATQGLDSTLIGNIGFDSQDDVMWRNIRNVGHHLSNSHAFCQEITGIFRVLSEVIRELEKVRIAKGLPFYELSKEELRVALGVESLGDTLEALYDPRTELVKEIVEKPCKCFPFGQTPLLDTRVKTKVL